MALIFDKTKSKKGFENLEIYLKINNSVSELFYFIKFFLNNAITSLVIFMTITYWREFLFSLKFIQGSFLNISVR